MTTTTNLSDDERTKLREQVEFYFSDVNLLRPDRFMMERMSENREGYIPIQILVTFKKVAALTTNVEHIAAALAESTSLQLNDDQTAVRRINPLPESWDPVPRTLLAYPIPDSMDFPEIKEIFLGFGAVDGVFRKARKDPMDPNLTVVMAEVIFSEASTLDSVLIRAEKEPIMCAQGSVLRLMRKTEYTDLRNRADEAKRKARPEKRIRDELSVDTLKGCVFCVSNAYDLGRVSSLKAMLGEELRPLLRFIHTRRDELKKCYIVACNTDAVEPLRTAFAQVKIEDTPLDIEMIQDGDITLLEEIVRVHNEFADHSKPRGPARGYGRRHGRGGARGGTKSRH